MVHLSETKRIIDPTTGKETLETNELVRRLKERGFDDATIMGLDSYIQQKRTSIPDDATLEEEVAHTAQERYDQVVKALDFDFKLYTQKTAQGAKGVDLLKILRTDLFADICGRWPLSGLNYAYITWFMLMTTKRIAYGMRDTRHPLYVLNYEGQSPEASISRRFRMILMAIRDEDPEWLRMSAEIFENPYLTLNSGAIWT